MKKFEYIKKELAGSYGSGQSTELSVLTTVKTGKTEAILEVTLSQRFPIQELEKAQDLYERLTCGSGRRVYTPEDLAHPFNPN